MHERAGYTHWILLVAFFGVYRLGQDYVLQPMLLSAGMRIHPLLIIFGVLAGGELGGIPGIFFLYTADGGAALNFPANMRKKPRRPAAMQPENPSSPALLPPPVTPPAGEAKKKVGLIGTIGALLLNFKAAILVILTKGKLVLLGLTKLNTLLSMLVSIGSSIGRFTKLEVRAGICAVDLCTRNGTRDGAGALQHRGQPAHVHPRLRSLCAFGSVSGVGRRRCACRTRGAVVGVRRSALACMGIGWYADSGLFTALAKVGAWINVFNLIPVWQLDGSRGFRRP